MSDEDIIGGLDLLGDWLDAKGCTEEAGLCTRAMDKINLLKAIASKAIREQIPLGEEIKALRAENARLREALKPIVPDKVLDEEEYSWVWNFHLNAARAAMGESDE